MYKYIENERSKALYWINREYLLRKYSPHIIYSSNMIETIIKYMYMFYHWLKYVKNYMIYDKYVYTLKEYTPPIEYEGEKIPRVAVYTCIFGDYDTVKEPLYTSPGCDYFIITDQAVSKDSIWKKIDPSRINELIEINDLGMKNRWVKMHPFKLFGEYDYAIYVDGCVRIVADLLPWVMSMNDNECLGIHEHPFRTSINIEAKAVIKMNKCNDIEKLKEQLKEYAQDGFATQWPLLEATVLVSNLASKRCKSIYNLWWIHLNKYVHRDQICLPYVLWKLNINHSEIKILGNNILINPRIIICRHRGDI